LLSLPKDQNRIFENIWNPIEENARDLNKQKSLVSDYIRDYNEFKKINNLAMLNTDSFTF
jgi:hypothetical protein